MRSNESAERMTEAATLARRYPDAKVLFTGGSVEILREPTVEADAAGDGAARSRHRQ